MLILSRKDLKQLLQMADVIEAVEEGFREYKTGRGTVPVRMCVNVGSGKEIFLFMPAYLGGQNSFGTKIVSVFPENPKGNLPTIQAAFLLNDPTTGEFLALMDGTFLTAIRTGATSAVATKYLSKKHSSVLGIIGTGAQALFQAEGICKVRPIKEILAYDQDRERALRFAERVSEQLRISVRVTESPKALVENTDVLVTVTTSPHPVLDGRDLKSGTHINAVGAYAPGMRELDDITIKKARIVVDTYEGCLAEAGDLLIPIKNGVISNEDIHGDLGEVILGQKPGRRTENEITVFKSVGFAVEDLVTAHLAYQRARERGVGSEFKLEG